jgi:hypothetical protein
VIYSQHKKGANMTKIQYERLQQDSQQVRQYIDLLHSKGEIGVVGKLQRKLEFIESRLAEVNVAA